MSAKGEDTGKEYVVRSLDFCSPTAGSRLPVRNGGRSAKDMV
jgi:hypothetical protein